MILFFDWISWLGVLIFILFASILVHGIRRWWSWNLYSMTLYGIEHGDENILREAPPPESLYDFWIDRITQDFILNQWDKVARIWFEYRSGFGEREATQKIKMLEYEKKQIALNADISEEGKRGSKARRKRWELWAESGTEKQEESEREKMLKDYISTNDAYTKNIAEIDYLEKKREDRGLTEHEDRRCNRLDDLVRKQERYLSDLKSKLQI